MTDNQLEQLARQQLADYDAHRPGSAFEDPKFILSVDDAYRLQIQVAKLRAARGEQVAGYKVGCISHEVRTQLGVKSPMFGHLFDSELFPSGVNLDPRHFEGLAIEGELAVRLAQDVAGAGDLDRCGSALIALIFPVIELHNLVFRRAAPSGPELIANNAIQAGVVLPSEEHVSVRGAIVQHSLEVRRNGESLGVARAEELLADALANLRLLVELLAEFGIRLEKGQLLLTGSPLPLYRVTGGDRVEVLSSHLGEVRASVGHEPTAAGSPSSQVGQ